MNWKFKALRKGGSNAVFKKFQRFFAAALLTGAVLAAACPAGAAGLLVADGGFGGILKIEEHDVKVTINNGVAVTEVTQVFRNTEKRVVEALYTFPVPQGASVSNFSMWINNKEMIGEVVEKQRAREIYNSYKRKRRDPGLLEQADYKTFEMRIFPIPAGAAQKVRITYYQELDFDNDWATYVYPLATVTRKEVDNRVQGRFAVSFEVRSEVPLTALESPSHGDMFQVVKYGDNYREASLETGEGDLARDIVLAYRASRPVTGVDLITSREKGGDGYFSLILTAGRELEKLKTGADYVFILDVSGSMANESKLTSSRKSIEAFIESLGPEDRFEIITFNRRPNPLFGKLEPAAEQNLESAVQFLRSQEALGGTSLEPALATAYKYGNPDRVLNTIILSDGMTEQDERRELTEMIRSRPSNIVVFCVGVGNEINRPLLKQLAGDAGGLAAFLSREDDYERQAAAFYRKLMHPVATDLEVVIEGADVYDVVPDEMPNLYHGMPVRIYGRYKKAGPADVTISATVNGRPIEASEKLEFPKVDGDNPEIERMWAWHSLQTLQEKHDLTGSREALDEIIRLGEGYSIASEYTSFIVLENDSEYRRWKIDRKNALRIKRDRAAQEKTRLELTKLREKSLDNIGPVEDAADNALEQTAAAGQSQRSTAPPRPPSIAPPGSPSSAPPRPPSSTPGRSSRKKHFNLPGIGGGAVDPLSGLGALALAGLALFGRRKKRRR